MCRSTSRPVKRRCSPLCPSEDQLFCLVYKKNNQISRHLDPASEPYILGLIVHDRLINVIGVTIYPSAYLVVLVALLYRS